MKETKFFIGAIFMISSFFLTAQVSFNTDGSDPDSSAMLDVKSSDKGFLPPRVANVSAVSNPVAGLMVYDQNLNCMRYYDGTVWSECMGKPFICEYPFMDSRDGKLYNSVQIGAQCWMAENLNYATGNSWCFDNDNANCDTYGRLYDWETALGICPSDWHLPTDDEWKILEGTVDSQYPVGSSVWDEEGWRGTDAGKNLKSTSGWKDRRNGTDLYGFGALPGGYRTSAGSFRYLVYYGTWWSSSEISGARAWRRSLAFDNAGSSRYYGIKTGGLSVRCLKDNGL